MSFRKTLQTTCIAVAVAMVALTGSTASAISIGLGSDFLQTLPGGGEVDLTGLNPWGIGVVPMTGLAVGPGQTDTIIKRTTALPPGGTGTIDAEIVALSLRSVDPVLADFGTGFEAAHVYVNLNPAPVGPFNNKGVLEILGHDDSVPAGDANGTFSSAFNLNVNVFVRADDFTGAVGPIIVTDTLISSGAGWSHTPSPGHPAPWATGDFYPAPIVHEGPHPVTFPAVEEGQPGQDGFLPPLCDPGFPDHGYQIVEDAHARWQEDPNSMIIELQPGSVHCPAPKQDDRIERFIGDDPVRGVFEEELFPSSLTGQVRILTPDGIVVAENIPVSLQGPVTTRVYGKNTLGPPDLTIDPADPSSSTATWDTEMISMSLTGEIPAGVIPGTTGPVQVFIDESQEHASTGRTTLTALPSGQFAVDSFFDVFTELRVGDPAGNAWLPDQPARMVLGGKPRPGDTDLDGTIGNDDIGVAFGSFNINGPNDIVRDLNGNVVSPTQQTITDKRHSDGDTDGDRDVDNSDLGVIFGGFDEGTGGPVAVGLAGHTTDHATHADLIYDSTTGDVKLDATEAAGGVITNFVLKNGTSAFVAPGTATFPFASIFTTDATFEVSQTDGTASGFSGIHDLGSVFPTGMTLAGLQAFLTQASYVGTLGSGNPDLDLSVVPEPGGFALLGLGLVGLLGWGRRRRGSAA